MFFCLFFFNFEVEFLDKAVVYAIAIFARTIQKDCD